MRTTGKGRGAVSGRAAASAPRTRFPVTLRLAAPEDCKDVWRWRNYCLARRYSFNAEKITWREHKEWYCAKLNNRNARLYIAQLGKSKVGVIRFDVKDARAMVSITLNSIFFGKGLGSKIIRLGTAKILRKASSTKTVVAEIKKGNVISQKAFLRSGYRWKRSTVDRVIYEKKRHYGR